MTRWENYLAAAENIIAAYDGSLPLHHFLKGFFREHPYMGSRDRKTISQLVYQFYRLGHLCKTSLTVKERICIGVFLCEQSSNPFLKAIRPDLDERIALPLSEKLTIVAANSSVTVANFSEPSSTSSAASEPSSSPSISSEPSSTPSVSSELSSTSSASSEPSVFSEPSSSPSISSEPSSIPVTSIFPFTALLSPAIDSTAFAQSFFVQPDLFIRTRNGRQKDIIRLLEKAGIVFTTPMPDAIALPNSTKIDDVIKDKSWYEIQDISSQQAGRLLQPAANELWWDCCAASGGKAILLLDKQPAVKLLVSDVRSSIIQNLHQRFKEAGIRQYESMVLDLTAPVTTSAIGRRRFDHILLDAPCSGSGTWARTPESLYFFQASKIDVYQQLQKSIAANVVQLLKPGGTLTYITCSVFKKENEDVVDYLAEHGLQKEEGGVIAGYEQKADSMFAVRLRKH